MVTLMDVHAIPAFADNYLWLMEDQGHAVAVDPGDAAPVRAFLERKGLKLDAILVTHHHPDHIGGIAALLAAQPDADIPVYGPAQEAARIPEMTRQLADGASVEVLGRRFEVLAVPGHTAGHIAYYCEHPDAGAEPLLLCGDTLFSAGCGRLFEGTPEQMAHSLARLAALPPATRIYCTHEYTLANLGFARAVEPDNPDIAAHIETVTKLRAEGRPSLPSRLDLEARINPFLRTAEVAVRQSAERWAEQPLGEDTAIFATLRRWKDGFRSPI